MDITDVRIRTMDNGGRMKAVASVTFDDEFVVHDIKIVEGEKGFFVAMPSKRVGDTFKDVAHPLLAATRKKISDAIFDKYREIGESPTTEPTSE
ncbi:MAG: septation regulator SpoVG [Bacillota bacterium]|nr:septation regulator SpoVG [Eubacteriales bacterium]MDD4286687.1 septation regulator SpoVG [Eubacteriales bacterium]MDI9491482.1 septation regulator SpoVG [Bacillota bacterium]HPF18262.1 septation regulator SpoVG [Bacillota bacterium]HRV33426.1 septation regulator SpoVG [Anaerovoracaceae bacterium]